ncbi:MAG: HAD family hydrolase [Micromonosporaceae bacterium]
MTLTVGFDLDLTLVDTRLGIAAALDELSAETGVPIDSTAAVARLGPPLAEELAHWFPAADVPAMVELFRSIYPLHAVEPSPLLPGAAEAFEVVRDRAGRIMVVTSKLGRLAQLHLDHLGLKADVVAGNVFGADKGAVLREHGASIYVGDHLGDVRAAQVGGCVSVGVTTGPISAADLRAAGADVVLADLTAFPAWLAGHLTARVPPRSVVHRPGTTVGQNSRPISSVRRGRSDGGTGKGYR